MLPPGKRVPKPRYPSYQRQVEDVQMPLDQKKFKGLGGIPLQTASDQKGVTLTLLANIVQMMMSQAQSRGNPKSFKPPKTPVGQCFEHRPRNALSEISSSSQMTRSQKRRWQINEEMARRMKVEYSESTGLIGKSQKTSATRGAAAAT